MRGKWNPAEHSSQGHRKVMGQTWGTEENMIKMGAADTSSSVMSFVCYEFAAMQKTARYCLNPDVGRFALGGSDNVHDGVNQRDLLRCEDQTVSFGGRTNHLYQTLTP